MCGCFLFGALGLRVPATVIARIDMRVRNCFAVSALWIERKGPTTRLPARGMRNNDRHKMVN